MNNNTQSKKVSTCIFCKKTSGKSDNFSTHYDLTWHITHEHKDEIDSITSYCKTGSSSSYPVIKREFEHD